MYKVGLVGAGGMGRKRAAAIAQCDRSSLAVVHDVAAEAAQALAQEHGAAAAADWQAVVADRSLDMVVVSTTHDALAPISSAALEAGKHVLCEKPMGRNPAEALAVVEAAESSQKVLKAGYNHRYHPAVAKIKAVCDEGRIGPLLYVRGRYGHGGRPGYEKEWRALPERAGGGEMLDQGAHLVDLSQWFLGEFTSVQGVTASFFWDMPLEDNAFGLFRTATGQAAQIHASWTQWKNHFSFEVFGRDGYAAANGLGRAYGVEHAVVGLRPAAGGAPREERFDFPEVDRSWDLEWADFLGAVETGQAPLAAGREALATMEWVYRLYKGAAEGRTVFANEGVDGVANF